ncbi:MAG: NADH-quinone oxidoreductase subunit NuoE [Anaerolineaceae bacterium]|nr:NADH-quinone oxidoreductase subunit NuoE [Anaerolineaceae bacterium]
MELSDETRKEIDLLIVTCETRREAMLQALEIIQRQHGHVGPDAAEYMATRLQVSRAEVEGVLSFYQTYHRRPVGELVFKVCRTLPCALVGASSIAAHLSLRLGIDVGQTSGDGRYTLLEVECLGLCDEAPAMMVNDEVYGNLTPERIDEVLASLDRE